MPLPPLPPRYQPIQDGGGAGGMGDTAICTDVHLDRRVLVKTLKPGTDPRRIQDEVAALAEVRSKHVVQLYDVITDANGEIVGLVEEYLDGNELPLGGVGSFDDLLLIGYPIARGISDIHEHGIVHRDIKPNNMKFDGEGCLKIYDFGLARFGGKNAHTQYIVGTPGFMAPELMAQGHAGGFAFDAGVDIYAFAVTLVVLVTGALPINATPFTNGFPIVLPAEIASILDSCLSANPGARPEMPVVCACLKTYLVRDKHRAFVATPSRQFILDCNNRTVTVNSTGRGSFVLTYDGLSFVISAVQGHVFVNNEAIKNGFELPGSCVVVLGDPSMGNARISISVDVSHPEVTL